MIGADKEASIVPQEDGTGDGDGLCAMLHHLLVMIAIWNRSMRLVLSILFVLVTHNLHAQERFRFPEGTYQNGSLKYINGLPVLTLKGTPTEMGEQAAMLVAKPANKLLKFPEELLAHLATPAGKALLMPGLLKNSQALYQNFPTAYRDETEAVLKHSGIPRETFIFGNTVFDQKHLLMSLFGCSAVIVEKDRSSTGQPFLARNMDYMGLGYLQDYTLVTIYQQPGKKAFASIGFPGTIGVISGINEAGLSIASLETTGTTPEGGPAYDPNGIPFLLNYRRILEECSTVDEAFQMLSSLKRTTTQHLAVCDKNGGAIFEYSPTQVIRRGAEHGTCRCTNHFITPELKLAKPKNLFTTLDRKASLDTSCDGSHPIGIGEAKTYLNKVHQNDMTLQSMIFEPSALRLHLAISDGKTPSSAKEYRMLEVGTLFR
jgi:isopenicillin-N N-acyltransferase-like protein